MYQKKKSDEEIPTLRYTLQIVKAGHSQKWCIKRMEGGEKRELNSFKNERSRWWSVQSSELKTRLNRLTINNTKSNCSLKPANVNKWKIKTAARTALIPIKMDIKSHPRNGGPASLRSAKLIVLKHPADYNITMITHHNFLKVESHLSLMVESLQVNKLVSKREPMDTYMGMYNRPSK